ncbi:hypothetical protein PTSG_02121 [Salpingoeca rosetta]|uniref:Uncharacterized protein n=1 Tax=Salpingoeca rosetta (strain ATCC 50818 / BSB-021) TaxID=946362 RepID=F2U197_SALR5|nr:uncharacterized protein PTSG_02121 [Salpingoeca rosetta]EGD81399.1 hypothetical protein PTSG_02121 [Salpingoeca rosetta]|eukprot:XP_004996603.1 hypothetical protein PTSG_02121 [Salpingoeca rosetta]
MSGYDWNSDWKSGKSFVGSLLRETAAERDERLRRERMEQEERQRHMEQREQAEFEQQLRSHRERELAEEARRTQINAEHERLWGSSFSFGTSTSSATRDRVTGSSSNLVQQTTHHHERQLRQVQDLDDVSRLAARFDHELEEQEAAELMEREALARRLREAKDMERAVALQEQLTNPLGLHYQDQHAPPPGYSQGQVSPYPTAPPPPATGHQQPASSSAPSSSALYPPPPPQSSQQEQQHFHDTFAQHPPAYSAATAIAEKQHDSASQQQQQQQQPLTASTWASPPASSSTLPPYAAPGGVSMHARPPSPGTIAASKPPSYFAALDEKVKQPGVSKMREARELFAPQTANAPPPTFRPAEGAQVRCASCFDVIRPDLPRGFSGLAVKQGVSTYHVECYEKSAAPHCAYCGRTLYPHPEMNLSGVWGEYKGKKYHVECYQYRAGPRCCSCFDVIFANPAKHLSGAWRTLPDSSFIHEECYQRRLRQSQ